LLRIFKRRINHADRKDNKCKRSWVWGKVKRSFEKKNLHKEGRGLLTTLGPRKGKIKEERNAGPRERGVISTENNKNRGMRPPKEKGGRGRIQG